MSLCRPDVRALKLPSRSEVFARDEQATKTFVIGLGNSYGQQLSLIAHVKRRPFADKCLDTLDILAALAAPLLRWDYGCDQREPAQLRPHYTLLT